MKVVKTLTQENTKKMDRLIEREPDIIAMLEDYESRGDANKITKHIKYVALGLVILVVLLYAVPLIQSLLTVAPQ